MTNDSLSQLSLISPTYLIDVPVAELRDATLSAAFAYRQYLNVKDIVDFSKGES
ncbi:MULTISPECIES: hypothetical protein [unclassified Tolypothrix]|uniref:hypothetical protein n=1 Tax=unclassified Tolypothrix TaxID=2649714 RepID=UPI0005EAAF24|nr:MULTISPECIES: hypothetical protein [unclassified Tolypothrix]BAY93622.1 hypothetical protein NIES3275_56630 [Microchaete diplosiphon NIES-3275]EKE99583.1 hypothetical protein FDUTEX481_09844 [Tolypothrix sp. PCC 7601]MBE9081677.1 hypothetical protein [Tolypothrix sp. LEGE 11397]UYD27445.1 hypothetical protein HGR01_04970 [Tolypothrix sp. PCC 7712]UYD36690.1 hypothetical protein HG267_13740 [Tolypothrix sp. PCC 7601]